VPHHISTAIPSYRLRMAHDSLKSYWGSSIRECRFNWPLLKGIVEECHMYDRDRFYKSIPAHRQGL
jgi:acyl-lipid omega-6 desaturase (Delta-12 desaturase)